jgi:hypothetical protein
MNTIGLLLVGRLNSLVHSYPEDVENLRNRIAGIKTIRNMPQVFGINFEWQWDIKQRPVSRQVVVWCGVVWCGVVWYGMVWYGMVWYINCEVMSRAECHGP